ncbi:MAG: methyltransferase domain-containing protein [Nitrospirota bacterium]
MTEFNKSEWAKAEFAREYRDNADVYIVERRRSLEILRSFYRHFLGINNRKKVLDLGCGDGIVSHELFKIDNSISATLIDGSKDMLDKAKERLKGFKDIHFIKASFQETINEDILQQDFNFIVSSLAIHHLTMDEKISLFKNIYSHLHTDGYFLNIDVILAPTEALEQWYLSLWEEWIDERKASLGIEGDHYNDIVCRYKDNKDNKPDTLDDQLNALKVIGFRDVDCFYKYGIFSMYGGRKLDSRGKGQL